MFRATRWPLILCLILAPAAPGQPAGASGAKSWTDGVATRQPLSDPAAVSDPQPTFWDPFPEAPRAGIYVRFGGLAVEQQEDARLVEGGSTSMVTFDRGYGFVAAIGQKLHEMPLSLELEYAYRNITADQIVGEFETRSAGGDLDLHTFSFNVLLDAPDLIGILGVYAGGGVGFVATDLAVRSSSGQAAVAVRGDELFLQAMAGITLSVSYNMQLYGGVRWASAGTIEDEEDMVSLDTELVGAELGLRIFF
ncbi:MAG: hypothetical protein ACF8R7_12550 [Phycisphaerales bacterium JB039]